MAEQSSQGDTGGLAGGEVEYEAPEPIYFVVLAFIIGMLFRTIGRMIPPKLQVIPVPYTGLMLAIGLAVGVVNQTGASAAFMGPGIHAWESISPELIFAVFLPVLVFQSALTLEWHKVQQLAGHALVLAIPGTLYNAALITIVARYVFPYSWSWAQSSLFGAIVSAVDPIAVVELIKSVGASARLGTIIDGESLLNDGVAYVLFQIFKDWVAGEDLSAGGIVGFTCQAVFGGSGLGLAFGLGCTAWLALLYDDAFSEIMVTVVTSYSCFLVSDEILNTSGILALVFCGLVLGAWGKRYTSSQVASHMEFFWEWADWVASTLIFFLSGVIIGAEVYRATPHIITATDWLYSLLLWVLLLVIRGTGMLLAYPVLRLLGKGVTWRDAVVMTWAGLRGAVGLVLTLFVLNSPSLGSLQYRELVFFHMAMMSALTLLIQGTTTQPLLKALGYTRLSPIRKDAMWHAAQLVERRGEWWEKHCLDSQLSGQLSVVNEDSEEGPQVGSSNGDDSGGGGGGAFVNGRSSGAAGHFVAGGRRSVVRGSRRVGRRGGKGSEGRVEGGHEEPEQEGEGEGGEWLRKLSEGGYPDLGEPDWKRVRRLSQLEVVELVESRPMHRHWRRRRAGQAEKEAAAQQKDLDVQCQKRDLRKRLLHAVAAEYEELFEQDAVSATQAYALQDSVATALDTVHRERLADWEVLQRHFGREERWAGAKRMIGRLLRSRRLQVQACQWVARRQAILLAAFLKAHRLARRELQWFEREEQEMAGKPLEEGGPKQAEQRGGGSGQQAEGGERAAPAGHATQQQQQADVVVHAAAGGDRQQGDDLEAGLGRNGVAGDDEAQRDGVAGQRVGVRRAGMGGRQGGDGGGGEGGRGGSQPPTTGGTTRWGRSTTSN